MESRRNVFYEFIESVEVVVEQEGLDEEDKFVQYIY